MGSYVHKNDSTQALGDPRYRTGLLAEQWVPGFSASRAGIQTHKTDKTFSDRLNVKNQSKLMEQAEQRLAWLGLRQWQGDGEESSPIVPQPVAFMESWVLGMGSGIPWAPCRSDQIREAGEPGLGIA